MIRINLLGEKVDRTGIYVLQGLAFFCSLVVVILACSFVQSDFKAERELLSQEKNLLENKLLRLKKATKKVEKLEAKKKLLQEKLTTIAMLKAKQHGPVRMLDDLNLALPKRAWIDKIDQKTTQLVLNGVALDNQTIAKLMHNLEKSKFFGDVDLNHSTLQIIDDVKLKRFSIAVAIEDALKVKQDADQEKADTTADTKG